MLHSWGKEDLEEHILNYFPIAHRPSHPLSSSRLLFKPQESVHLESCTREQVRFLSRHLICKLILNWGWLTPHQKFLRPRSAKVQLRQSQNIIVFKVANAHPEEEVTSTLDDDFQRQRVEHYGLHPNPQAFSWRCSAFPTPSRNNKRVFADELTDLTPCISVYWNYK